MEGLAQALPNRMVVFQKRVTPQAVAEQAAGSVQDAPPPAADDSYVDDYEEQLTAMLEQDAAMEEFAEQDAAMEESFEQEGQQVDNQFNMPDVDAANTGLDTEDA